MQQPEVDIKHHGLGPMGAKAIAIALVVSIVERERMHIVFGGGRGGQAVWINLCPYSYKNVMTETPFQPPLEVHVYVCLVLASENPQGLLRSGARPQLFKS